MKSLVKSLLTAIVIIAAILLVLWGILRLLYGAWLYSFMPSSGIWQYKDDDLEIVIYIPPNGGTISGPYLACKAEYIRKGEKRKAILFYNTKMYQYRLACVDEYEDIENRKNQKLNYVLDSSYVTPMKKNEWELKNGKSTLIFKKIGKYRDPE